MIILVHIHRCILLKTKLESFNCIKSVCVYVDKCICFKEQLNCPFFINDCFVQNYHNYFNINQNLSNQKVLLLTNFLIIRLQCWVKGQNDKYIYLIEPFSTWEHMFCHSFFILNISLWQIFASCYTENNFSS